MSRGKVYPKEFIDKVIQEYDETKSYTAVAKKNSVSLSTVRGWVQKSRGIEEPGKKAVKIARLEKELNKKDIEIQMLKELLKKTNQVWLKD